MDPRRGLDRPRHRVAARAQDVVVDEETGEVVREVNADGTQDEVVRDEQGRIVSERKPVGWRPTARRADHH